LETRGNASTATTGKGQEELGRTATGGVVESKGKHVELASLFLEQLRERLGPGAVAAISY